MKTKGSSENDISLKGAVRDVQAARAAAQAARAAAQAAPLEPGVYIMRDGENRIIYVGKARVLRNRLASYFSGEKDIKTATLMGHVRAIETIITANEYEALLLENTLIKQHGPKYNINLKDGKTYPVIRITAEDFPRIFRTRHILEDGSRYFGPFPNVSAVDTMLELIDKLFPLRKCGSSRNSRHGPFRKRDAPCMYYHIGRCAAPCCGRIDVETYGRHVERVRKLLAGETGSLIMELTEAMHRAAGEQRFERAIQLRDAITAIGELSAENAVVDFDPEGRDYIAWATEGVFTTFTVFSMRGGKMTGRELFRTRSAAEEGESLETFIAAYYVPDRPPPARIYLAGGDRDFSGLDRWFTGQFGYTPELYSPGENSPGENIPGENIPGDVFPMDAGVRRHRAVLAMARQNALEDLRQRLKERGAGPALDELAQALGLKTRPERIEGFDIAQLDGKHPVASLISFQNGIPDRKNYRHFKLRTVVGVVDDFAAMREAVQRRYSRLIREGKELPDLVLIDGGIGQVNAAKGVFDELGMDSDVVGLAKRDEELWLPHARQPIRLSKRSEALKVLQFVRDETHRFATSLNQRLRSKDLFFPILESVEGIGPKRAAAIMKAYQNLPAIAAAPAEDLAEQCGISLAAAKAVRAAAKLALEDQEAARRRLARGKIAGPYGETTGSAGDSLAAEAAEPEPDYCK
ncbi:MAG: excinuclease ABC subunit UvrC [Spirochaetaceae bacterium]|jgi:excinuclease ABC subunit C|nr:excinuclease ABC subunit UvrC [Spirochaetaceae bacterium]